MRPDPTRTPVVLLPDDVALEGGVSLLGFQRAVQATDKLPQHELDTSMLGLFGEVGSLLTVVKKQRREAAAYPAYDAAIVEEFGDVLWYFTSLVTRAGLDLSIVSQRVSRDLGDWDVVGRDEFATWGQIQEGQASVEHAELSRRMSVLAGLVGELVSALRAGKLEGNRDRLSGELVAILRALIATAQAANVNLDLAARRNLEKIFSRYPLEFRYPPLPDALMPSHERLPRSFEILIEEQHLEGKTWVTQTLNGVLIGDRLTDNKGEADDYRFHDVFHIAYAVHLGWSPILRGLLRVKRKSDPKIDESDDGARAGLIEEGIATFIFGRALERNLFEGLDRLDFDLLKLAHGFVRGFEAERCAYWQWERAILDGFKLFRELKKYRRGYVRADLEAHTLKFRPVASGPEHVT